MARMIAADDERGGRKVILPRNRQTTITDEKQSTKCLKHGTTRYRREKHVLRSAPVRHWMSSVVSFAPGQGCGSFARIRKNFLRSRGDNDLRKTDETSERAAGGYSSLTPEGVPTPFTVARSAMLSNQEGM